MKRTAAILGPVSDATLQAPPTDLSELLEGCGVIDRSERGKLALGGPDATEFLNGQVTNELLGLAPGEGRYAAFLTHKGKMLGDLRILHAADPVDGGAPALLLDTERCALQALFDMIRRFKVGYDIDLHKRTLERGLISLIGPLSGRVAEAAELAAEEHSSIAVRIGGLAALAIRRLRWRRELLRNALRSMATRVSLASGLSDRRTRHEESSLAPAGSCNWKPSRYGNEASRRAGRCQAWMRSWSLESSLRSPAMAGWNEVKQCSQTAPALAWVTLVGPCRRSVRSAKRGKASISHSMKPVSNCAGSSSGG